MELRLLSTQDKAKPPLLKLCCLGDGGLLLLLSHFPAL